MKNLYLLLFVVLFACKGKEEPKPESKTASLVIEYTGSYSSPICARIYITPHLQNSEYFYTDTATSISKTVTKPNYKGGQSISVGAANYLANGQFKDGGY
jgi:hypothetical protein